MAGRAAFQKVHSEGESASDRLNVVLNGDEPVAKQLTRALRRAIVTTRIPPGEMLSEQEIADGLGLSRQPVREAIINLRDLGLIRVFPQRGTQVVKISPAAVESARFIREAIECAVVREAASRADIGDIFRLRENVSAQQHAGQEEFFELDEEFHRLLAQTAKRPTAWEVVERVKPQMDRVRFLDLFDPAAHDLNIQEHTKIVEALADHDAALAEQTMQAHLRTIRKTILPIMAANRDMFEDD
jgi:DNA-binding GntR family transcriptional regulator